MPRLALQRAGGWTIIWFIGKKPGASVSVISKTRYGKFKGVLHHRVL